LAPADSDDASFGADDEVNVTDRQFPRMGAAAFMADTIAEERRDGLISAM
jgi:hypothetical protein